MHDTKIHLNLMDGFRTCWSSYIYLFLHSDFIKYLHITHFLCPFYKMLL